MTMNANDAARVIDTILSIPGMNESVKIDFKISRKNVLLLSSIIERGVSGKTDAEGVLGITNMPEEVAAELTGFMKECLQKAGLTELNEKLKSLNSK